jgi:hypothetical protein
MINQSIKITSLLFIFFFTIHFSTYAVKPNPPAKEQTIELNTETFLQELEHAKGEKLNIFEKLIAKAAIKKAWKNKKKKKKKKGIESEDRRMAVAAMVLGISSFVVGIIPIFGLLALPAGILAVIFGSIALKRIKEEPGIYGGRGMALAGLILGIVFLSIVVLALLFLIIFLSGGGFILVF